MSGSTVVTVVASLISAFNSGLDIVRRVRRVRQARKSRKPSNSRPSTANSHKEHLNEERLSRSLERGPQDIQAEYERDYQLIGGEFERGDIIAQARLADTLLKLNTGLVGIIAGFLAREQDERLGVGRPKASAELDWNALTKLSDEARVEAVDTLGGLFRRMSSTSLVLRSPKVVCGRCVNGCEACWSRAGAGTGTGTGTGTSTALVKAKSASALGSKSDTSKKKSAAKTKIQTEGFSVIGGRKSKVSSSAMSSSTTLVVARKDEWFRPRKGGSLSSGSAETSRTNSLKTNSTGTTTPPHTSASKKATLAKPKSTPAFSKAPTAKTTSTARRRSPPPLPTKQAPSPRLSSSAPPAPPKPASLRTRPISPDRKLPVQRSLSQSSTLSSRTITPSRTISPARKSSLPPSYKSTPTSGTSTPRASGTFTPTAASCITPAPNNPSPLSLAPYHTSHPNSRLSILSWASDSTQLGEIPEDRLAIMWNPGGGNGCVEKEKEKPVRMPAWWEADEDGIDMEEGGVRVGVRDLGVDPREDRSEQSERERRRVGWWGRLFGGGRKRGAGGVEFVGR